MTVANDQSQSSTTTPPPPRILHLLHTLPVQAVLLSVPPDALLTGPGFPTDRSSSTAWPGSAMPMSNTSSRRHSRASTFSNAPTLTAIAPTSASPAKANTTAAAASPTALATALGEVQAQLLLQQQELRRSAAARGPLPTLRLLGSFAEEEAAHHQAQAEVESAADPIAIQASPPRTTKKWALAPRRGHSALYAGVQSLAGRVHAPSLAGEPEPATVAATVASTDTAGTGSAIDAPTIHECVFVGTLGPVVDMYGRIVEGYALSDEDRAELERILWKEQACVPVFLERDVARAHYEGYCKTTLWPLFHYQLWETATDGRVELKDWNAYEEVNHRFAALAAKLYTLGDLIWVHDYHLLLTPSMLRAELNALNPEDDFVASSAPIGLFIHTPFPSSEVFRCLPKRAAVLEGILGASLVGTQTYSYARHFVSCCTRVLGLESSPTGIDYNGHHVEVGIFPIGIDASRTEQKRRDPSVTEKTMALADMYVGKKIVVGRDKLDSMRGVYQKLKGFQTFLESYPEWRGKVVLIQVTSPTTTGGQMLAQGKGSRDQGKLEAKISELVANINGKYGSLDFSPVHHIHRAIAQDEFYGLLSVADVGLITSVRDGMNTSSHEFVVCQQETWAPLVLSEFTGCASSLAGAVLVNPWDFSGVAAAIMDALTMTREEKYARHAQMMDVVARHTAPRWAQSFTRALTGTAQKLANVGMSLDSHTTSFMDRSSCLSQYREVVKSGPAHASESAPLRRMRLICFDYDGTLSPIVKVPDMARPSPDLLEALETLCADQDNRVFVISGRDQATLDAWLGHIPSLGLSAEHGSFLKYPYDHRGWLDLTEEHGDDPAVWKAEVISCFNFFTERTPGSFIEHKRMSITWHYRQADPSFGAFQAKQCQNHLENSVLSKRALEILVGKKNLEVRPMAVNKGEIVKRLLATAAPANAYFDFVFSVGDDRTDEDMFRAMRTRGAAALAAAATGKADGGAVASVNDSAAATMVVQVPTLDGADPAAGDDAGIPTSPTTSVATGPGTSASSTYDDLHGGIENPRFMWTVTVGPATKKTLADWHLVAPSQVVDVVREWAGLPRVGGASPVAFA
ncbi:glycosyltransferase family 20-domain-containing protein [Blastocladiella britannica]|nr:glycosyltransferase family 20-domain-containing protein [Blastocladiella britannica]